MLTNFRWGWKWAVSGFCVFFPAAKNGNGFHGSLVRLLQQQQQLLVSELCVAKSQCMSAAVPGTAEMIVAIVADRFLEIFGDSSD
jgi:hypothetical protein